MSGSSIRTRQQREALWHRDPHCYYCGVLTVLVDRSGGVRTRPGDIQPNEATIEHLHPRHHPERGKHEGEYTHVLACWACNNAKGREHLASLGIDKLRALSQGLDPDDNGGRPRSTRRAHATIVCAEDWPRHGYPRKRRAPRPDLPHQTPRAYNAEGAQIRNNQLAAQLASLAQQQQQGNTA